MCRLIQHWPTRIAAACTLLALFSAVSAMAQEQDAAPVQGAATPAEAAAQGIEFFERHVRPVLVDSCYKCHGPDSQKAGLRFDSQASAMKGSDGGAIILPGDVSGSKLAQVIQYNGRVQMPPDGKLPDEQIQAIMDWIAMGAPWPADAEGAARAAEPETMQEFIARARAEHWSFKPVVKPAVPEALATVRNEVDRFVYARLAAEGLEMSPEADKRTLLRRLYFDLIGLPPSTEEMQAFLADSAEDAYDREVDRLLASPRFGERWARYWLDIARYADTKGYVFQEDRFYPFSHTYRNYVIQAYNDDKPYDDFIREQIAADLMDRGGDDTKLAALGFLTLGRRFINNIHDITDDRIDVVTRGMLGLTVSCARCHDHKYDPISAADYYALYGVFRSASEPDELPLISEPNPDDPKYQEYLAELAEREQRLEDVTSEIQAGLLREARERFDEYFAAAHEVRASTDDEPVKLLAKEKKLNWQIVKRWRDFLNSRVSAPDEVWRPYAWYAALTAENFAAEAAAVTEKIKQQPEPVNQKLLEAFGGPVPEDMGDVLRRYVSKVRDAHKAWLDVLAANSQRTAREETAPALPPGLGDAAMEQLRLVLYAADSPSNIPRDDTFGFSDVPTQGRIRDARNSIANLKATHPGRPDRAMALEDNAKPFDPYVFGRGKPENNAGAVPRRFLELFSGPEPQPFAEGSGRLEMANAIVDPSNPLAARVYVNRVWLQLFGQGLVDTPSDFGVRSNPPANPELLDYLAATFMENGWSTKNLVRSIVLSQAYRQVSTATPVGIEKDPENRLVWRQNRERLDFEALRDSLLAASGRLDLTMFGHSVDITAPPFPARRTVYSFIERQNLPGLFRTFDFASPDTHSPRRFETTVPQQALYMMNSPFVVEQARHLAAREAVAAEESVSGKIRAMYELVYQREPDNEELGLALQFLETAQPETPEAPPWQYGYGAIDEATGTVQFTAFPFFSDNTWKGGAAIPDPAIGWAHLNAGGGHPGKPNFGTVLRWVSPVDGVVAIEGQVHHGNENGDGVIAYLASSKGGMLLKQPVFNSIAPISLERLEVQQGDIIDFIIHCGANETSDGYGWIPKVRLLDEGQQPLEYGQERQEWLANIDFSGPPPPPLQAWEQYAQALLLSNEFVFVD